MGVKPVSQLPLLWRTCNLAQLWCHAAMPPKLMALWNSILLFSSEASYVSTEWHFRRAALCEYFFVNGVGALGPRASFVWKRPLHEKSPINRHKRTQT